MATLSGSTASRANRRRNRTKRAGVSFILESNTARPRKSIVIAISLSVLFSCLWIATGSLRDPPLEPRISVIALSETGRWLAGATPQGTITIWRMRKPAVFQQIEFARGPLRARPVNDLHFSPGERSLAIAGGDLGIYALEQPNDLRILRSDSQNYGTVRFSADGESLLVITGRGLIEIMHAGSGTARQRICCSTIYGEVAFTPDGKGIANAGHWPGIWDARSGQNLGRLTANRESYTFRPIAFDKRHGTILMGSQDGRVYAWDLAARQRVAVSPPQSGYVDALAVSATGWAAYAAFGNTLRLWNPTTGEQRSIPAARPTSNVIFDRNGTLLLFGTADGAIEFWDVSAGQRVRTIQGPSRIPAAMPELR